MRKIIYPQDRDEKLRYASAGPGLIHDTWIDIIDELSRDPDIEIRMTVASNTNTPASILYLMAYEDPSEKVKEAASRNVALYD